MDPWDVQTLCELVVLSGLALALLYNTPVPNWILPLWVLCCGDPGFLLLNHYFKHRDPMDPKLPVSL